MIKIGYKIYQHFTNPKVTDENGKEIISFEEAKALPTRACYSIIDSNHKKIGKIEKSRYNFGVIDLPKIVISINTDEITIQKDVNELVDSYELTGSGFSIAGNVSGPHFNILQNEKVIASVDIDKEEAGDAYLVDIIDKSNENQVICILFALSWIM